MRSFCPDVNVWIALVYEGHAHHGPALEWFANLENDNAYFCRLTQLAFLRLLTNSSVMRSETRSQAEAWRDYDALQADERVSFYVEAGTRDLDAVFRRLSTARRPATNQWPDAYLAAFSQVADLAVVTFDRALHRLAGSSAILLS